MPIPSTETGSVVRLIMSRIIFLIRSTTALRPPIEPETVEKNWDYFELSTQAELYLKPKKDISDLVFELIMLARIGDFFLGAF
jgi:hypothetical protein